MAVNGYSFRFADLAQVLQQNARSLVSLGFQGLGIGDVGIAESEGMRSAEDTSYVDACQENEMHRTREGQATGGQIGLPSPSSWQVGTVTNGLDMDPQAPRKLEIDDLGSSVVQSFLGSPMLPNVRVRADGTAAQFASSNSTALQIDSDGRRQGMANKQVCSAAMIDETSSHTLFCFRGHMFESTES